MHNHIECWRLGTKGQTEASLPNVFPLIHHSSPSIPAEKELRAARGSRCRRSPFTFLAGAAAALTLLCPNLGAQNAFLRLDLVSDIPGLAANTDTNLVNPWGLALSDTSLFWVADKARGVSTRYDGSGAPQSGVVTIPILGGGSGRSTPTGVALNDRASFEIAPGKPARAIFATAGGTIAAWSPAVDATHALLMVDTSASGAIYAGLAIGSTAAGDFLYAANFRSGSIEVFNTNFARATLPGSFTDPILPSGYAPFNIQNLNSNLYVTYARQAASGTNDLPGLGNGIVDVFDLNGNLARRLITGGPLNSPWGLALAPPTLAGFPGKLLVGNSGDGRIHAFDPASGVLIDVLRDAGGSPLQIAGLRGLIFGRPGTVGNRDTLYFTAAFAGSGAIGDHGLFGSLEQKAPMLSIECIQPASVRLLWPTNDPLFGLEFSTNPSVSNWTPAQPPPVLLGSQYVVTNPAGDLRRIYRLHKP